MQMLVRLRPRSYPVIMGHDLSGAFPARMKAMFPHSRFGLVTNTTLAATCRKQIARWKKAFSLMVHVMPDGERFKTLETWERVLDVFLRARFERSDVLIAFGGGVVGDITGFAAATLLRGVRYVQVPTTLLAMVDSSVGGKTGVDWVCRSAPAAGSRIRPLGGKNLIGAFHQPQLVWIDTAFLRTLPEREYRAGLAELVKYAFLGGRGMFDFIARNGRKLLEKDRTALLEGIRRSIAVKARIVEQDERETSGRRMLLNIGHTFAHALEKYFGFEKLNHGEAVWWGMACAVELGKQLKTISRPDASAYDALLAVMPLPKLRRLPETDSLCDAMRSDKKVVGGKIRFVVPAARGRSVIRSDVPPQAVRQVLREVLFVKR